jgi:hypothetical protein
MSEKSQESKTGTITYRIIITRGKRRRREPVMDLRRKGVCHFEVYGTGKIVKARKNCPHIRR